MLEFLAPVAAAVAAVIPERVKEFLVWWLQTPDGPRTFLLPWAVQFVFSWVGFSWFAWAYVRHRRRIAAPPRGPGRLREQHGSLRHSVRLQ